MSEETRDYYDCAHCGQETEGKPIEQIDLGGQQLDMCCLGCACAAQLLHSLQPEKSSQQVLN